MSKLLFIDFEFNKLKERNVNPICVSFLATSEEEDVEGNYWLLDPEEREEFIEEIKWYIEDGYTFVAFYAAAEARSLYSLGINAYCPTFRMRAFGKYKRVLQRKSVPSKR